jgi:hypothetical protein
MGLRQPAKSASEFSQQAMRFSLKKSLYTKA